MAVENENCWVFLLSCRVCCRDPMAMDRREHPLHLWAKLIPGFSSYWRVESAWRVYKSPADSAAQLPPYLILSGVCGFLFSKSDEVRDWFAHLDGRVQFITMCRCVNTLTCSLQARAASGPSGWWQEQDMAQHSPLVTRDIIQNETRDPICLKRDSFPKTTFEKGDILRS